MVNMKKLTRYSCLFVAIMMIVVCGHISSSSAAELNVGYLEKLSGFYYDDNKADWTYVQSASRTTNNGTSVDFRLIAWGNKTELVCFPEMRFYVKEKDQKSIIIKSATFIVDGNMFDLTLKELDLTGVQGVYFNMTSDAVPMLKSFINAENIYLFLHIDDTQTISLLLSEDETNPLRRFAEDMLYLDYLHNITSTELQYESEYKTDTPIESLVFGDGNDDTNPFQNVATGDGWKEYNLGEIGVRVFLPSDYDAYTRGMDANDPVLAGSGLTPERVDQLLVESNEYLESFSSDNSKQVIVTMIGNQLSDFSDMSDDGLMALFSWILPALEGQGVKILDKDVYSNDQQKYLRSYQEIPTDSGTFYRIQYYTVFNLQAINLIYVTDIPLDDDQKKFMESVVDRAVYSKETSAIGINSFSQDPQSFTYTENSDGSLSITGYTGITPNLAIPSEINGKPVTSLTEMEKNNFVANVLIPDSITQITGNPFAKFSALKSVTIRENHPQYIVDDGILYSKDKNEIICYPAGRAKDSFAIPGTVKTIGKEAFYGNDALKQLTLPEGLAKIGDNAFFGVDSVKSIRLPASITYIGSNPFYGMSDLEEIEVAGDNKRYGVNQGALYDQEQNVLIVFPHNKVVDSFDFQEGITAIGDNAFGWNSSTCTITFPDTITYIGDGAFFDCASMKFTNIPSSVEYIGPTAFASCVFDTITIPGTVKSMGNSCFNSAKLNGVTIENGVTQLPLGMFVACDGLTSMTLPESIESIGNFAFRKCENLEWINIPAAVKDIGESTFEDDTKLTVQVVQGSYGEKYCKQNGISYTY